MSPSLWGIIAFQALSFCFHHSYLIASIGSRLDEKLCRDVDTAYANRHAEAYLLGAVALRLLQRYAFAQYDANFFSQSLN